jgi:hypothetical protein
MQSLSYWHDGHGKTQPRQLKLLFDITGAAAASLIVPGAPVLFGFTATPLTSTLTDAFLGTTSEFPTADFDATSMGADAFGGVINMGGQCKKVVQMVARCYSSSNTVVTRQCPGGTALTDTTLTTECAVGAYGNIGFKVDFGNTPDFDGLTDGTIEIIIDWISK